MFLQLLAVRAITHQRQTGVRKGFQHGPDPFNLLFGRETTHVKQQSTPVVVIAQQPLTHGLAAQLGPEQIGVDPPLPQIGVLDPFVTQLLHHGGGGAEVEQGLIVRRLQQFPEQGLEHAHAVVLQILGQVGVIAGDQRDGFGLGQPDPPQSEHGWVHHMNQVGLEVVNGFRNGRPRQGQLQLGVERQRHGRHPNQPGSHVLIGTALRAEHDHLIAGIHQMLHRFGESGDDAVDLRQEGFGEEGDFQGETPIRNQEAVPMA